MALDDYVKSVRITGRGNGWNSEDTSLSKNLLRLMINDGLIDKLMVYNTVNGREEHLSHYLGFIGQESIENSEDSMKIKSLINVESYQGHLEMRIHLTKRRLRFEIEDDGNGLDADVEPELYKGEIKSKKNGEIFNGKRGSFLFIINTAVRAVNGDLGFVNKGSHSGAIFWYEFPVIYSENQV